MQKTWHRDYAAESIKRIEHSRWTDDHNYRWATAAVECGQVAELALRIGEAQGLTKITDIARTVIETIDAAARGGAARTRSYRKITDAQRHALAVALLEKYGSARAIAAAVWQLTDAEIDNAD